MYDRATNSLWSELLGEPVIGPLAGSGIKLEFFPVTLTTWGEWLLEQPDTTVLALDTGVNSARSYQPEDDEASLYFDYRETPETMFPIWDRDERLETKDEVLGFSTGVVHKAYPIWQLQMKRVVNDSVGDTAIVILASAGSSGTRIYAREGQTFELADGAVKGIPKALSDSTGARWDVTNDYLVNSADPSEKLARLPSHVSFWFGWFAFHPDTLVYGIE